MNEARPYPLDLLNDTSPQRTLSGETAEQVAMPLGGIGAGSICLTGCGGMEDFSIRNKPDTTALPDGHGTSNAAFATLRIKGERPVTRLVEGPFPTGKIYAHGTKGQGYRGGGHEGLPRFKHAEFRGEFPFGCVTLSDPRIPLAVSVTGFNPFIPLDDVNSGIPCAILEYTLENRSGEAVAYEFAYHLSHLAPGSGKNFSSARSRAVPGAGVFFSNTDSPNKESFGSAALAVIGHEPAIKGMWFRGGWFDSVSALWRELSTGAFRTNDGSNEVDTTGRSGGSILMAGTLQPGEQVTYPIVIAWHFPNCHNSIGGAPAAPQSCGRASGECCSEDPAPKWRPFYTSQWKDAWEVAAYVRERYASLRARTQAFHDALFASSLPSYALDAVSANLAILKSPTVLRQASGNLWGWEGCFSEQGCCYGTCTHVWNYAQALPHLFPQLERTLREQELLRSMDESGQTAFRAALPDGPTGPGFRAAADGQLGGIMKLYRDWQISGDRDWLQRLYPRAKRSLDFCIDHWDPDHRGVLMEPHHNTYDIEFWGPDGMCSSIYLGALAAMAALARDAGHPEDAPFYEELAARGARYLDDHLFNGEYYYQKTAYEGLRDTSFAQSIAKVNETSSEVQRLLKAEGPKYQYGTGCLSDGVLGAWMARIYGIETPQTREKVAKSLAAIFAYNFREELWEHACTQRPGYAWGCEPGLLLCSWPRGGKPTLPFPYSDEVWTGIEYQVASHLIEEGFVAEGLTIVKAARSRYDGRTRNPWNEYECGNYYARAMASYALLGSLAGFRYSAATRTLHFGPRLETRPFRTFFSTATGWGTLTLDGSNLTVEMAEGELAVDRLVLTLDGKTRTLECGAVARVGENVVVVV